MDAAPRAGQIRPINLIVIHCSATPSGQRLVGTGRDDRAQSAAEVIDGWHRARGFARSPYAIRVFSPGLTSIGYHLVIDIDGMPQNGRSLDEVPAQAAGFNQAAIGICMVGGAETEGRYTEAQWSTLRVMVGAFADTFDIPLARPTRAPADKSRWPAGYSVTGGVCGHRDLSPDLDGDGRVEPCEWLKTCPGFDVATWLERGMSPLSKHVLGGVA